MTDLDKMLAELASEYAAPAATPPSSVPAPRAPAKPEPAASTEDLHPSLRALLEGGVEVGGRGEPTPEPGPRELAMLASLRHEASEQERAEQERQQREEDERRRREAARQEAERRREEARLLEARRQEEARAAEAARQEAARQEAERRQAEAQRAAEERRRAEFERAVRARGEQWLKALNPDSPEGMWFAGFAEKFPSRLEAAIVYLREVKGIG